MNNSTRFLSLFSPHPPRFLFRSLFLARLPNLRLPSLLTSINPTPPHNPQPPFSLKRFHTHRATRLDSASSHNQRLPEWSALLLSLSESGYSGPIETETKFIPGLPDEFITPALACLALARDRPELLEKLSRRDVRIVVENGKPFVFVNGDDSVRKMSLFLKMVCPGIGKILDMVKASTVDLMRFLLSYVVDVGYGEGSKYHNREVMEASVRRLLREIVNMSFPGSFHRNVEMVQGDWICSRCSGMNFGSKVKCYQCLEARPKRQLTGSEWECPQCDFYNYGRNVACLRCDCKRPGDSLISANSKDGLERRLAENEEKAQRWFSKVAQGGYVSNSVDTDEDFPEIMPLRKGVNRFVVSTRKTPLERRLASSENSVATGNISKGNDDKALGSETNRSLNEILGSSSSMASRSNDKNVTSKRFESSQVSNTSFVPFVPLPSDMFAKKPDKEEAQIGLTDNNQVDSSDDNRNVYQEGKSNANLLGKETEISEKEEKESEEKSARWFERVTELHNVSDSETPEENSPESMPMRQGENQFVVSRKKDRSLTSPANKRRMSIEPKDSDFVPFVPFPPDYFAKAKQPEETTGTIPPPATIYTSQVLEEEPKLPSSNIPESMPGKIRNGKSLEGSLVKEPDLLDMSEEAKAERWFKRVADIRNISELSQIPDEDFPSIMPMRKGVNRFVVSKRKTPLERRLASQRQQRNPPITDSDLPGKGDT